MGVLFGNAYRLTEPSLRPAPFTEKCLSGAKRLGVALINTCDLFYPIRYLKETNDLDYARICRIAILKGGGKIVIFPVPPTTQEVNDIN